MPHHQHLNRFILVVCLCLAGCDRSKPPVADPPPDPPQNQNAVAEFPTDVVVAGVKHTLPADPEELLDFLNKMADSPPGDSVDEQTDHLKEMLRARALGAEKLLTLNIPNVADYRTIAARAKLESLQLLSGLGEPQALDQLLRYAQELEASDNADLSRIGQLGSFVAEALTDSRSLHGGEQLTTVEIQGASPEGLSQGLDSSTRVIPRLTKLLESQTNKDLDLLGATSLVARDLLEQGHPFAGAQALLVIGAAFRENPDENLARMAGDSIVQGGIAMFQEFQRQVIDGVDSAKTVSDFESQIALLAPAWSAEVVGNEAANFAIAFEQTHGTEASKQVWETLAEQWKSQGPQTSATETLLQRAERAATRRALIGQSLALEGRLIDNSPFLDDFPQEDKSKSLRIVMIWNSQSELATAELHNLEAILQGRGKRTYDIVLVCLDEDLAACKSALEKAGKDWPVLFSHEPDQKGLQNPWASLWGIDFVPYFLVADTSKTIKHTCCSVAQLEDILKSE